MEKAINERDQELLSLVMSGKPLYPEIDKAFSKAQTCRDPLAARTDIARVMKIVGLSYLDISDHKLVSNFTLMRMRTFNFINDINAKSTLKVTP